MLTLTLVAVLATPGDAPRSAKLLPDDNYEQLLTWRKTAWAAPIVTTSIGAVALAGGIVILSLVSLFDMPVLFIAGLMLTAIGGLATAAGLIVFVAIGFEVARVDGILERAREIAPPPPPAPLTLLTF